MAEKKKQAKKDKQEMPARETTKPEKAGRRRVKRVRRPVKRKNANAEQKASSRRMWVYVLLLLVVLSFAGWRLWRSDSVHVAVSE